MAAAMQEAVDACGRDVVGRTGRYNAVLDDCRRLIEDLDPSGGLAPGAGLASSGGSTGFGGTRFDPVLGARLEGGTPAPPPLPTPGFAPAPPGPTAEVFPLPAPLPRLPGFLPAPDLGAGVQDGPGSGQRVDVPPVQLDRNGQSAATPEARRGAAGQAILRPDGSPPGVPGSSPEKREVDRPEFERIHGSLNDNLGPPDRVLDTPKGRVEIWDIGPDEHVVYRTFSRSGNQGLSAPETIDVHDVQGLENVVRIHVKE